MFFVFKEQTALQDQATNLLNNSNSQFWDKIQVNTFLFVFKAIKKVFVILFSKLESRNQLHDVLQRQYRQIEEQEMLAMQNQAFDFISNQAPAASTPINVSRDRFIYQRNRINEFDRANPNRFSNNNYSALTDNIQQPTPDDKLNYFAKKNSE